MKKLALILTVLGTLGFAGSAMADGHAVGHFLSGDVIADGIYGNTSNPSGNGNGVLPSLAPGPWKCVYDAYGNCVAQTYGGSMGEFISPVVSGGNAKADFGNGGTQSGSCSDGPVIKPGTEGCPD